MVNLKRALLFLTVILFAANPFTSVAAEEAQGDGTKSQAEEINAHIKHHLEDDHYFTSYKKEENDVGCPLRVISIDNGLRVFSSGEFKEYDGLTEVDGQFYKYYHANIYKTDAAGTIDYDAELHPTNA